MSLFGVIRTGVVRWTREERTGSATRVGSVGKLFERAAFFSPWIIRIDLVRGRDMISLVQWDEMNSLAPLITILNS